MIYVNNVILPDQKKVYTIKEIAEILDISERHAYNFCNNAKEFAVIRIGKSIRVKKDSFDLWFGN